MLLRTLLIGIFPFTGMLFYSYYKNTTRQLEARPLPTPNGELVVLKSAYHQEKLILPPSKIIYIEPADNYVAIHYLDNLQVQKKLIGFLATALESGRSIPWFFFSSKVFWFPYQFSSDILII